MPAKVLVEVKGLLDPPRVSQHNLKHEINPEFCGTRLVERLKYLRTKVIVKSQVASLLLEKDE